jgi:hypothetical protein
MESLQHQLNDEYNKLSYYNSLTKECNNKIVKLKKEIFSKCEHKWVVDHSCFSEHTEYICSLCNLSKYDR